VHVTERPIDGFEPGASRNERRGRVVPIQYVGSIDQASQHGRNLDRVDRSGRDRPDECNDSLWLGQGKPIRVSDPRASNDPRFRQAIERFANR
jgi:hypothetical protein